MTRRRYAPLTRRSICLRLDIALKRSICVAGGNASEVTLGDGAIDSRCQRQHIECERSEHISIARNASKYRVAKQHIDKKTKEKEEMTDNKYQLREDAIEFALQISDLCDEIKGCSAYVNQIIRSSSSIGANIHEAKYAQSKADFINKL